MTDADACQKEFAQLSHDFEIRHHQPLRLKKKIYEFYTAPITKFWADSVSFQLRIVFQSLPLTHLLYPSLLSYRITIGQKINCVGNVFVFFSVDCLYGVFDAIFIHGAGTHGTNAEMAGSLLNSIYHHAWL